jgi:predicted dithiol-disulfide oxidoreductase (DUF899 family)
MSIAIYLTCVLIGDFHAQWRRIMADTQAGSTAAHAVRFPNETNDYRKARDGLLGAEIELRRQIERVAALRRTLPLGGAPPEDYVFDEASSNDGAVRRVRLSELFGKHSTLVAYSYMYGPQMERPCPSCSSVLDGLNGQAEHVRQRAALVVIAKSPIERIMAAARERGWTKLRLLSSAGNSYNRDYHGEDASGSQRPCLNVFTRRDGTVRHFWASEMLFAHADPGQNHRHVDMIWPLWNVLDCVPEGRGSDWYPQLRYTG